MLAACFTHARRTVTGRKVLTRGERASNASERAQSRGITARKSREYRTRSMVESGGTVRPRQMEEGAVRLGSWGGKGAPSQRSVAGLGGRPATVGMRHGPDSYGRQKWGILDNGRKPYPAMPRAGRRPSGFKLLLYGTKRSGLIPWANDGTVRISTG